ncbi:ABC transporter permease [Nocardioides nitrophenolicus]|uniref:ABC transporter permease n=1 Tax=Nocardioides nitrophenolicus TaxID=60489 RepID=UPI00195809A1|nr:ABC transporter permease subunit [Nocardioides nitrophenolicus]MBM7517004.1 ABC-type nitrate/sulfonate/bicarbonate transport system permease component [Nocardioides nitrophenolicus]
MTRTRAALRRTAASAGSLWLLALVLALWEIYGRTSESLFVPPISRILGNFGDVWLGGPASQLFLSDLFWSEVTTSLYRFARGWGLAVVVGIAAGVVLGRSRVIAQMYGPVVRFFAAIPNTVLLPVAVQIFGVASSMNVFLIFLGSVWVVMINTADGVAGVDPMWLRSARSMRVSRWTLYRRVIIPAAAPQILAGLRVSLGIGLILMVISELYATTEGLGFQIVVAQSSFRYLDMWSAFVLIGLIGIVLNLAFGKVETRLLRWQRRTGLDAL